MKRQIKFRGQRTDGKGWVYGDLLTNYIHHKSGATITYGGGCVLNEVKPETVGQFTGIKDKNGTEVYEGDVLTASGIESDRSYKDKTFTVSINEGCMEPFYGRVGSGSGMLYETWMDMDSITITGNIHEQKQEA